MRLPSLVAAAMCAAALSASAVLANASVVRLARSQHVVQNAAWHYENGVTFATPHYMATTRNARPQLSGLLNWGGGYVQHPPTIYLTFWGWKTDPANAAPFLTKFLKGVGGSKWLHVVTQYYDGSGKITNPRGQLKGVWNDPSAVPSQPTDAQIAQEALNSAKWFNVSDQNASYVIATPTGHNSQGFGSSYCAYHGKVSNGGVILAYTNLPYMPDAGSNCGANSVNGGSQGLLDGVSIVEGHELAETQTDPNYFTGWNGGQGEIGDICVWQNLGNTQFRNGTFAVQPLYSDFAGTCVRK
jgi:hypothetical protein